jgi:hypothetical protein
MTAAFVCSLWAAHCSPHQLAVLDQLLEVSREEKANPLLVAAVAWAESRWHADRVSKCGARGPLGVLRVWLRRPLCFASIARADGQADALLGCGVLLLKSGFVACRGHAVLALGWYHTGKCRVDGYARRVWRQYQEASRKAARKVTA